MSVKGSWEILEARLVEIIRDSGTDAVVAQILDNVRSSIDSAKKQPDMQKRLTSVLLGCFSAAKERWDTKHAHLPSSVLTKYF